jgi:FKBP-type peptidyl-prolyl cis-trans isomerase
VLGKDFAVKIPAAAKFKMLDAGSVTVKDSGFYSITIAVTKKARNSIADIRSIQLSGTAAAGIHYNPKPRRNAASVHLRYPIGDSIKTIAFYNEITIPAGFDHLHSYYMACGFARGYFGIQVNSESERRVIFSVWDAGKEAVDRNKVADSNKVMLLAKGDEVLADGFGNEGTGGHSHWVYPWKTGQTYKMMVTALTDSASQTTIYTGYFFLPELQKWKLIASFRAPKDGQNLRNLYSFNENFWGVNGQLQRKALFGNQWIQKENGQWVELTKSTFSYDATGKAGDRIDYGAGVTDGKFYLWNGGFQQANAKFGDELNRPATNQRPAIDWTKNADSAKQAERDKQMIFDAVNNKQIDTTGSKDGVYYQIVKEGTGNSFTANDTVTVFYKGTLLKDGSIFDQTKEKPAIFPLKRLIRGWQIGVPMCKVGGKIRIFVPSGLGYTIRSRSKAIPPNSVLVFDIDIVGVKK